MIAFVRGPVSAVFADSAVVEVGGIGIQVLCTPAALASLRVGAEANLATSMVVREESLTLYGFADYDERGVFELVQTASGVGPKLAQAMLAVHGPDELRRAIVSEDLATLCAVPGIGRKGAQRIVLELRDKIGVPTGSGAGPVPVRPSAAAGSWRDQVREALIGLGWSAREADSAVDAVAPLAADRDVAETGEAETPSVPELLRAALQTLSKA
jgi:holliday junction DNA helicase RuvA